MRGFMCDRSTTMTTFMAQCHSDLPILWPKFTPIGPLRFRNSFLFNIEIQYPTKIDFPLGSVRLAMTI